MQPLVHPTAAALQHVHRKAYAELMYGTAYKYARFAALPHTDKCRMVLLIERECYNRAVAEANGRGWAVSWTNKQFVELYSTECNKYITAINSASHYYLDGLIDGKMDPTASYTNIELDPEATRAEREILAKRKEQKIYEKYFKSKQCRICQSKKIVGCEYQARALDEGSAISYKCTECGYVWRK